MMEIIKNLFLLSALVAGIRSELSLPQCKVGDNDCLATLFNGFYESSAAGIPEIDLVPTNPYRMKEFVVEQGKQSPVNIKIQFKDANLTGIHLFKVDKVIGFEKDPRNSKMEMRGTLSKAIIKGLYEISGKFLLLPISGKGVAEMEFENVKFRIKMKSSVETRDGKDYIVLEEMLIKMEPEKVSMDFDNLFNNKELSDNMNKVLNENSILVYKELQGPIQKVLGNILKTIFAPVCKKFSYTDLFMKE